jgi:hypothetical protein
MKDEGDAEKEVKNIGTTFLTKQDDVGKKQQRENKMQGPRNCFCIQ